ncbi:MAG TPA: MarR family transcriptional regulator [Symbiobacteriaceae bacterium]|nr:MarR family transcriptional regulator [Symbiobacteriaceae bacterium]
MVDFQDNLGRYLSVAARHLAACMARRMEELGIGAGQYPYLFSLYSADGLTQQQLSDRLRVDKSATVGAINRLEALGYVERRSDPKDRRSHCIYLTDRGREIRPRLEAIAAEVLGIATGGLSAEEQAVLLGALKRVAANLTQA